MSSKNNHFRSKITNPRIAVVNIGTLIITPKPISPKEVLCKIKITNNLSLMTDFIGRHQQNSLKSPIKNIYHVNTH